MFKPNKHEDSNNLRRKNVVVTRMSETSRFRVVYLI